MADANRCINCRGNSRKKNKQQIALTNFELPNNFLIDRKRLNVDDCYLLGEGEFGYVYKGTLKSSAEDDTASTDSLQTVAIKLAKDEGQMQALVKETKIMATIGRHFNVLALIGACICEKTAIYQYVVFEFCSVGSLHSFLTNERKSLKTAEYEMSETKNTRGYYTIKEKTSTSKLPDYSAKQHQQSHGQSNKGGDLAAHLSFAFQTANGMDFLSSKMIHRDLAARNLLLTLHNDVIVVKIADFGLARRRIPYSVSGHKNWRSAEPSYDRYRPVPVGWMAPEALLQGRHTIQSDCWSFGVVLREIFTLCDSPDSCYEEQLECDGRAYLERYDQRLTYFLVRDGRLTRPSFCSDSIWQLMTDCWALNPNERPSFSQCRDRLQAEMESPCLSAQQRQRCAEIIALIGSKGGEATTTEVKDANLKTADETKKIEPNESSSNDFEMTA